MNNALRPEKKHEQEIYIAFFLIFNTSTPHCLHDKRPSLKLKYNYLKY